MLIAVPPAPDGAVAGPEGSTGIAWGSVGTRTGSGPGARSCAISGVAVRARTAAIAALAGRMGCDRCVMVMQQTLGIGQIVHEFRPDYRWNDFANRQNDFGSAKLT